MAAKRRTTTIKSKAAPRRRTSNRAMARKSRSQNNFANFFVPLFLIFCLLGCLGFLGVMGYRTVTASEFFNVRNVDVRGATHAPKADIERIVRAATERSGVWNTDLNELRIKIEGLDFVRSAAVSRVLPDGVRVNLVERNPKAVVRLASGDFWVDEEGFVIALVKKDDQLPPFVMKGWDETKNNEDITKKNVARIKTYQRMLDDWKSFDLDKRVKSVDLADTAQPHALVEDSGQTVDVVLSKDNFGKKLQDAIENIAGKGKQVSAIDMREVQPRLTFRQGIQ